MLCRDECPRGLRCKPISNLVTESGDDFVCVGYHNEVKERFPQDRFRHCFKSKGGTDTMFDYDEYDLKSTIAVMSEALLIGDLEQSLTDE